MWEEKRERECQAALRDHRTAVKSENDRNDRFKVFWGLTGIQTTGNLLLFVRRVCSARSFPGVDTTMVPDKG